jgi:hypothetical protein
MTVWLSQGDSPFHWKGKFFKISQGAKGDKRHSSRFVSQQFIHLLQMNNRPKNIHISLSLTVDRTILNLISFSSNKFAITIWANLPGLITSNNYSFKLKSRSLTSLKKLERFFLRQCFSLVKWKISSEITVPPHFPLTNTKNSFHNIINPELRFYDHEVFRASEHTHQFSWLAMHFIIASRSTISL